MARLVLKLLLSVSGPTSSENVCPEKQHVGKDNCLMPHPQRQIKRRGKNLNRYVRHLRRICLEAIESHKVYHESQLIKMSPKRSRDKQHWQK